MFIAQADPQMQGNVIGNPSRAYLNFLDAAMEGRLEQDIEDTLAARMPQVL